MNHYHCWVKFLLLKPQIFRYLCDVFDSLLLQQSLVKPLSLLCGHVGLISGEEANLVCVSPLTMGQRTKSRRKRQHYYSRSRVRSGMTAALWPRVVDSHADSLCRLGDPPEGEEQADRLIFVREQGVGGRLGFQESLQGLDSLFHLIKAHTP